MKKILVSLFAATSLLMGGAAVAKEASVPAQFECHFSENTLLVSGTQLEESRLFSQEGALLDIQKGKFCEFELTPGEYRLLAKVGNKTKLCKVTLK